MRRIIYRSTAAPELNKAEMFRLVFHARVSNEAKGLTGVLLQAEGHLLQILEGPTWKVAATFDCIRRDIRHTGVAVLTEHSIRELTFPRWPMRYFDDHHIGKALTLMHEEAQHRLSAEIEDAVSAFFIECFVAHETFRSSPPRAAGQSVSRSC